MRRVDGLRYFYRRNGETHGYAAFRREDANLQCERMPGFGWAVRDGDGVVNSRPFADPGLGDLPPEGMWVSGKGDRAYVYDLIWVGHH